MSLQRYSCSILLFGIILFTSVTGPTLAEPPKQVAKLWEEDAAVVVHSIAVSNSGRVGLVDVPSEQSSGRFRVFSSSGTLIKQWTPPAGSSFSLCRAGDGYFYLTYGVSFTLLSERGKQQIWGKSVGNFAKTSLSVTENGERLFLADDPFPGKSTVWSLNGDGNVLWSRQLDSRISLAPIASSDDGYAAVAGNKYGSRDEKGKTKR